MNRLSLFALVGAAAFPTVDLLATGYMAMLAAGTASDLLHSALVGMLVGPVIGWFLAKGIEGMRR